MVADRLREEESSSFERKEILNWVDIQNQDVSYAEEKEQNFFLKVTDATPTNVDTKEDLIHREFTDRTVQNSQNTDCS